MNKTVNQPQSRDAKPTGSAVVTQLPEIRHRVAEARPQAKGSEKLDLSETAVDLNRLELRIKQLPELDAARLVELHNRITAGEYEVDAESVANKILDLESSL